MFFHIRNDLTVPQLLSPRGGTSRKQGKHGCEQKGARPEGLGHSLRHWWEIHFLWVSRPLRSEWMNMALRNPFMLQEGIPSFLSFLKEIALKRDGESRGKCERRSQRESEREKMWRKRERESQRPFISLGSFLVTRAVIFCLSASEEPSGSPSSFFCLNLLLQLLPLSPFSLVLDLT